jgi:ABC-2 type transport system ATP-binding protein
MEALFLKCLEPTVVLQAWSCQSGQTQSLQHIDMQLWPGQVCLLYGANGAGKSTLLKLLAGLLHGQRGLRMSGQGAVLGQALSARQGVDRARVGYMPQQGGLYEELSVLENLRFRAEVLDLPLATARVQTLCESHGLLPVMARKVGHLSGGWRQRVAFAVAMLAQPRLLLLDEPTAGVDLDAKAHLWAHIRSLAQQGVSILVSTHDTQEVMQCDALLALAQGRVCHTGSPQDLMAQSGGLEAGLRGLLRQGSLHE